MMLARYKKIANFTFLARWANLAIFRDKGVYQFVAGILGSIQLVPGQKKATV